MKHSLFLVVFIVLLSSCAQQIQNIEKFSSLSKQQQQQFAKIPKNWDLSGKISIIHEQENWYARFYWIKKHNQFQLRFTGPLGETYLSLEQEVLEDKVLGQIKKNTLKIGKEIYTNQGNIEDLLAQYSDIKIPINSLQYWIFGHYYPYAPFQLKMLAIDTHIHVIAELYQQDWKIQFSRYQQHQVDKQAISHYPAKMLAKNDKYSIKVFVSSSNFSH